MGTARWGGLLPEEKMVKVKPESKVFNFLKQHSANSTCKL